MARRARAYCLQYTAMHALASIMLCKAAKLHAQALLLHKAAHRPMSLLLGQSSALQSKGPSTSIYGLCRLILGLYLQVQAESASTWACNHQENGQSYAMHNIAMLRPASRPRISMLLLAMLCFAMPSLCLALRACCTKGARAT